MPNPENIIPPKKGEVRNPAGKLKGTRNRSTIVREMLELMRDMPDHLKAAFPDLSGKISNEQIITLSQLLKAESGDTNAYKAVMDSAYGAPKQTLGGEGDDEPIRSEITHRLTPGDVEAFKTFFNGKY